MIYLVRHGEAAASWGAHPDPGLSETGKAQANSAAISLSDLGITHAFSSPMQRCQETGAAFAERSKLALTREPDVTEIPTPSDIEDRVSWLRGLMGGSWVDAPDIVQAWHSKLLSRIQELPEHSVVFTHFVAINAIVGHLEGNDAVTVFRPNYCSITKLDNSGGNPVLLERGQALETKVL
ncbi:MAG: histidine phosphatase family protein [Pseudomonadota bacterium]